MLFRSRVRVANQPTFVRYVFDLPNQVNAMPERGDGKLTINFDQQIKWYLADAKATLPSTLESIEAETDFGSAAVIFTMNGAPDVRTFREDGSIVVDVGTGQALAGPSALATTLGIARRLHETLLIDAGWIVIGSTAAMLVLALLGVLMGLPRFANTL